MGQKQEYSGTGRAFSWHAVLKRWYERYRYRYVFYRTLEKESIIRWLNLQANDRVCELGSFNGANAREFSLRYDCTIYGVDLDRRVVNLAQSFNKTERTHYLVAAAEYLPFASERFDKMYAISALEHFTDEKSAFREAFRCLKSDGVFAVSTDSFALGQLWPDTQKRHQQRYSVRRYYSPADLAAEFESVGFEVLHLEPILRHWSTGLLFESSVRIDGLKSAAYILLPLLRWLERNYGSTEKGYMHMICAIKRFDTRQPGDLRCDLDQRTNNVSTQNVARQPSHTNH
jgi:SAM-dependent methyltransferase